MIDAVKDVLLPSVRWLGWRSGVLRRSFARRHAESLTVFGLHRVLRVDDPRWRYAMPTWTVSDRLFRSALEFVASQYNVVDFGAVARAMDGASSLPQRAALITFDDGWADTADTAAPILAELGLPAVVFVISGLVGERRGTWDAEWYAALQDASEADAQRVSERFAPGRKVDPRTEDGFASIAATLRLQPVPTRFALLDELLRRQPPEGMTRMMTADDVVRLHGSGFEIGAHGKTHEPLRTLGSAREEISESLAQLAAMLGAGGGRVRSFSFPHGSYDQGLVDHAVQSGARMTFTSDLGVNVTPGGTPMSTTMGRLWIGQGLAARDGALAPDKAAWRYFRARVLPQAAAQRHPQGT